MGHGTERAPTTPVNTQPPHCRSVSARRAGKSADTNGCEVFSRIVGNRVASIYPCYYHEQELVGLNGMDRKCSEATPTFFVHRVFDGLLERVRKFVIHVLDYLFRYAYTAFTFISGRFSEVALITIVKLTVDWIGRFVVMTVADNVIDDVGYCPGKGFVQEIVIAC
ncbi:hypothetical protein NC651_031319 [Populus alba x Populus x berolinensis]|nr:hypothetical protein NC651_031319 [Populus alba x Populus x berolinensis]